MGIYAREGHTSMIDKQGMMREYHSLYIVNLNEFNDQDVQKASKSLIRFYHMHKPVHAHSDANQ